MEITSENDGLSNIPDKSRLTEENHELYFISADKVDNFTWTVEEEKSIVQRAFEILEANGYL